MGKKQLSFEFPEYGNETLHLLKVEEIYDRASQSLMERLTEDRRLERKEPRVQPQALGDYFSMWSNTGPEGGLIVVGMGDHGEVLGCSSLSQDQINLIEKTRDIYCPDANFQSKRIKVVNTNGLQDFLMIFYVEYRDDRVVETTKGNAFIRSGDAKRKLRDDERRQLEMEKGQVSFESEPCGLKWPDDFDVNAIQEFVRSVRSSRGLSESHTMEQLLTFNRLGTIKAEKFVPNNACALLFALDPNVRIPGCRIRFFRFDGVSEGTGEKFNAVKDIWIEGSVPRLIAECEKVLDAQIRSFSKLGGDGRFYTEPEYPKWAWYEAIVNACAHRSYSLRNMCIFVKMFDDRLVVESPGSFPPLVTPQNIYEVHHPRNPHLMNAMYYLDYVKCAHEGTRRMRDTMLAAKLPAPEFSQKENGFVLVRVTLRNNIIHRRVYVDKDASSLIDADLAGTLDERERQVVNYAAEYQSINVSQAQRLTGGSWSAARKLLMKLTEKGIFEHSHRTDVDLDPKACFILKTKS